MRMRFNITYSGSTPGGGRLFAKNNLRDDLEDDMMTELLKDEKPTQAMSSTKNKEYYRGKNYTKEVEIVQM